MVVRDYVLLTLFLKFHNLGQQLWHFCPLSNCPSKQNRAESGAPWSPCTVFPAIITLITAMNMVKKFPGWKSSATDKGSSVGWNPLVAAYRSCCP